MTIDAIDLYWRPGCGFCMALERKLAPHAIPTRAHNIWDDPAAAAFVRSVADGNETVPTVVIGSQAMVNPRPHQVLAALTDRAPHLLPDDFELDEPGPLGRLVERILGA